MSVSGGDGAAERHLAPRDRALDPDRRTAAGGAPSTSGHVDALERQQLRQVPALERPALAEDALARPGWRARRGPRRRPPARPSPPSAARRPRRRSSRALAPARPAAGPPPAAASGRGTRSAAPRGEAGAGDEDLEARAPRARAADARAPNAAGFSTPKAIASAIARVDDEGAAGHGQCAAQAEHQRPDRRP